MKIWIAGLVGLLSIFFFATPVQADCGDATYTVKAGDTLASIAEECGMNYVVLGNINYELNDPNVIRPGQVIRLVPETPLPESEAAKNASLEPGGLLVNGTYQVRNGDSLGRIAYYYDTTIEALYDVNPQLGHRPIVYTGQILSLPAGARKESGWIGLSKYTAYAYDEITVSVKEFPVNQELTFSLVFIDVNDDYDGDYDGWTGYDDDFWDSEDRTTATVTTNARGEAKVTLQLPYWAYDGEIWAVVITQEDDPGFERYSQNITIGEDE